MTNEELTAKFVALDERVTRHTEQIKTIFNQLDELRKNNEVMQKLVVTVELLAQGQAQTNEQLEKNNTRMDELADSIDKINMRPVKRWSRIAEEALKIVMAALVGGLLAYLGLK